MLRFDDVRAGAREENGHGVLAGGGNGCGSTSQKSVTPVWRLNLLVRAPALLCPYPRQSQAHGTQALSTFQMERTMLMIHDSQEFGMDPM